MLVHEKCIQLYLKHKIIKCMHLFLFGEEESGKWIANYERLAEGTSDEDRAAHMVLKEELVVALALGGARTTCVERYPGRPARGRGRCWKPPYELERRGSKTGPNWS